MSSVGNAKTETLNQRLLKEIKLKVAILTYQDIAEIEINQWIDIKDVEIHLYIDKNEQRQSIEALSNQGFSGVNFYHNYLNNGNVMLDVIQEHQHTPFDRIVYFGEDDVIRSSLLAEKLGLPGISQQAAFAYRDKYEMKNKLEQADVSFVPRFRAVTSPLDIIEHQQELGYPIFIKPRTSAGSTYARKIADEQDMREVFANDLVSRLESCEYESDLIVEEYVVGQMYHIDGFVDANGQVECLFPSRYLLSNLELTNVSQSQCLSSVMLEDSKLKQQLIDATTLVIERLPKITNTPIHAEFFVKETGDIVFCEIGARTGGAGVNQTLKHALGIDLNQISLLAQLGLPYHINRENHRIGGWSLFNPMGYKLNKKADADQFPFLAEIKFYYHAGDVVNSQTFSSSKVAKAIATDDSEQSVIEKLAKGFDVFLVESMSEMTG